MLRFDYASYRTEDRAYAALEDMYATGDVCEAEDPRVERRRVRKPGPDGYHTVTRFVITLPG